MSLPIICEKYVMLTIKTLGLNQVFFTSSQSFFFNSTFSLHEKVLKDSLLSDLSIRKISK